MERRIEQQSFEHVSATPCDDSPRYMVTNSGHRCVISERSLSVARQYSNELQREELMGRLVLGGGGMLVALLFALATSVQHH